MSVVVPVLAASTGTEITLPILVAVFGEVLAVLFVLRILARGGSTAATLNWVFVILAAPWLGLALYYLLPRRIQLRRLRRRAHQMEWISSSLADTITDETTVEAGDATARLLRRLDPDALRKGNVVVLLETGSDTTQRAIERITAARHFVHLETYILRPDETGRRLLRLLAETARRGVEVRVLYDSLGSWSLRGGDLAELLAAGGQAVPYAPLLWRRRPFTLNLRNHRKLLVVDGEACLLGGRNIGDEYAEDHFGEQGAWLDTMIEVRGPAVPRLHRVFVEDWYNASGEDLTAARYFPEQEPVGEDTVGIVATGPDTVTNPLPWVLFQIISSAERSLDISSPYLVPDVLAMTAVQVVAARGVRVRVHTNGRGVAQFILHRAMRGCYADLMSVGVEIYESRSDYNHSKLILADDRVLLVGSPNLDIRSEQLNFEIAVAVTDAGVCRAAADMFERRLQTATRVRVDELDARWWDQVLDGFCRLLSPLL